MSGQKQKVGMDVLNILGQFLNVSGTAASLTSVTNSADPLPKN
jgi:hypothetical protein